MGPKIVCCGGADSDFIKALDRDPMRKAAVQYPFSLNPVQKEKLMHKPSSVSWKRQHVFDVEDTASTSVRDVG